MSSPLTDSAMVFQCSQHKAEAVLPNTQSLVKTYDPSRVPRGGCLYETLNPATEASVLANEGPMPWRILPTAADFQVSPFVIGTKGYTATAATTPTDQPPPHWTAEFCLSSQTLRSGSLIRPPALLESPIFTFI